MATATGLVVLVVDDRADKRLALSASVADIPGVVVMTAESGAQALALAERHRFAVILLDVHMPGMSGLDTARRLRANPETRHTPIIFVTAGDEDHADQGYALGAVDYLFAPYSSTVVKAKVGVFVELARRDEQVRALNDALHRRLEELTALNEELEAFTHSVSHDLRAPARHVTAFSEMLDQRAHDKLNDQERRFLANIGIAARRMSALIDDLLGFARIGRVEAEFRDVDLGAIVASVLQSLQPDVGERRIEWQIDPLPVVHGDRALLSIVFTNLLSNAIKYTRGRDPAHVAVTTSPAREGRVVLIVRDDGAGFDMAHAERLFGVFQRLHHVDEFEGTGVGLATVRRIVARHGGRTWAEAAVDKGATFFVELNAAAAPAKA